MPTKIITRQELYNRVWTETVNHLSKELGISNVGLGKLCRRHDIPVPPRGYWAKKQHGHRVKQTPLPDSEKTVSERIIIHGSATAHDDAAPSDVHPLVAFEQQSENLITVADDLALTHPAVIKTERLLKRSKRDDKGMIVMPPGALRLHSSRALHPRGLRIWQALLTALEARQFAVEVRLETVAVTVLDESLTIAVDESTKRVEHAITFTEQKQIERGYGYGIPKCDEVPSGQLTLAITNISHARQRWTEGSKPIEQVLNKFLVGLVRAALEMKRQREEAARQAREREEQERQRQEDARRAEETERLWREEQGKVERLERLAAVWRRNQELRRLIAEGETAAGGVDSESELGQWLAWAADHAERSDPLRRLRQRAGRTLTVYYHGYDHERIPEQGFSEATMTGYRNEKQKAGVELTCRPSRRSWYEGALKIELPEDLLLPYEWTQESDWYWRTFRVPAALLNRTLKYGNVDQPDQNRDVDTTEDEESDENLD